MAMEPRSFLPMVLPPAANRATEPMGVALEHWPPVLEYICVFSTSRLMFRPRGQHVVQAAVADVEGPAVAADAPDALLDEVVGHASSCP